MNNLVHLSKRWLTNKGSKAARLIELEHQYGAHNYSPIPVVISRGSGIHVWDVEDKKYMDFLAAYSAVNQGHCHPRIVNALIEQAKKLTLTSRAFHNDLLGEYCEFITSYFNYSSVLPMNTGVEACESSMKIARRWGYEVKKIPSNKAMFICCDNNFWGRSIAAVSASTDPSAFENYGPFVPGIITIPYNDIHQLEITLQKYHQYTCAFMAEPIQGEAGVIIPDGDYLDKVRELCDKYNVLWIADEVQTGLGRCAKDLCVDWNNIKPDLITLGKALSGGTIPISAVLAKKKEVMDVLTPGTHGSTYGGNPLACKVAIESLNVLKDEKLSEKSEKLGEFFLNGLEQIGDEFNEKIKTVRGRGLFCAIEIYNTNEKSNAWNACLKLKDLGLLAKPTHDDIIRLSPPLCITKQQLEEALTIIRTTMKTL